MIRPATPVDAAAICGIWNPVIRDTTATFTAIEKTPAGITALLADKAASGHPFWVSTAGDDITGFATYGPFRGGDGYRHTVEHTVHLAPAARGLGTGRALMAALCDHAAAQGMHSMWAGCSGDNPGAVRFHERLGFVQVAHLPQVGRKFDRWIDLILLQKML